MIWMQFYYWRTKNHNLRNTTLLSDQGVCLMSGCVNLVISRSWYKAAKIQSLGLYPDDFLLVLITPYVCHLQTLLRFFLLPQHHHHYD